MYDSNVDSDESSRDGWAEMMECDNTNLEDQPEDPKQKEDKQVLSHFTSKN